MSGLKSDTIGGFNDFLAKQREVEGKGTLTMVHFADDQKLTEDMSPLENMEDLTSELPTTKVVSLPAQIS